MTVPLLSRFIGLHLSFIYTFHHHILQLGFFDPLGLVADGDQDKFDRLRFVEIKHGRICMLAVAGYLVQEAGVRLPGDVDFSGLAFADVPNGFAALTTIQGAGVAQIVAFIGFLELFVMKDITGGDFVGDFRNNFIDFGWCVLVVMLRAVAKCHVLSHFSVSLELPGTLSRPKRRNANAPSS